MVAPEVPPTRNSTRAVLLLLSWMILASCAAPAPSVSREPVKPAATPPPAATPAPAPTPAPLPPAPVETKKDILVVVDPGGEANPNRTLVEAARAERERRTHAKPPVAVINDKNLKRHATGHLTIMKPNRPAEAKPADAANPEAAPAATTVEGGEVIKDEAYWRGRALEIRQRWRNAADEVDELEQSAAGWRRRFYAENDRYVRDGQIKPEWDRVLDRLEKARAEAETAAKELTEFLEEGRVAGAYPGWLREGADLEPEKKPEPSNEHQAIEPPVVGEDGPP